ncbi:MAG: glycosyltransferase family 4 protein [archaeon]|nr:glycosyltransferase family 4 protein [archaeon]
MVVTDINFPHISGGARRTLETARILSKMGNDVIIFTNKLENQKKYSEVENFKVYRKKLIEPGIELKIIIAKYKQKFLKIIGKNPEIQNSNQNLGNLKDDKKLDCHLDIKKDYSLRDKIKDIYRHKIPLHKLIKGLPSLPNLLKIIKEEKIDVIYERSSSYGIGVLAGKLTGRITIIDFIDVLYWNWALKKCDRILSYFTTYQVPSFISRNKIDRVYTSADDKRFNPSNDVSKVKEKMNLTENTILGVYVGGFYYWHGLKYIIAAIDIIKKKSISNLEDKNLKILMIGNGESFKDIVKLIEKHDLKEYFILPGRIDFDEVPQYINIANFCLSTNLSDSIGLKTFEYLACAKPLIASNVDIIKYFFKDMKNILFIKPADSIDLAKKIEFIIQNPEKAKEIGKNARKLVEKNYTWKIHGKNIIKSIIKSIKKRK